MPLAFSVKLGACTCELTLDDEATIGNLHDAVRAAFDVPEDASLRLLTKGKSLPAGLAITLVAAGVAANSKLMVMQTQAQERTRVEEAQPERMRGFEEDDRRLRTGSVHSGGKVAANRTRASASKYRFGGVVALAVPEGVQPGPAAAEALLRQLSTDPSILAILEQHRWSVGELKEMAPVGHVGVSESCLMGLNVNAGQEILLRCRTDDWCGLRPYHTLIEVLLHELTHNVHGDHDDAFKTLNSQLKREYREHASARTGRTLEGAAIAAPRAEAALATAPSGEAQGHVLGGDAPDTLDAREAAAQAALARVSCTARVPLRCVCGLVHTTGLRRTDDAPATCGRCEDTFGSCSERG